MNRNILMLVTFCALAAELAGCAHRQNEGQLDLLKVEHQDAQTKTTESYTAYLDSKSHLIRHGPYLDRYASGAKYVEAHYTHGKLDGEFRVFTEEGQTALVGSYKDGKPWEGLIQCGDSIKKYSAGEFRGYVTNLADPRATNAGPTR